MHIWGKRIIYDLSCMLFSVPLTSTTAAIALFSDTYTRRYGVIGVYLSPEGTCWDFQASTSRNEELDWGHTDSDRRGGRVLRKHIPETGRCLDQDLNSEAPGHSALILDVLFNSTQFSHTQKSKGFLNTFSFVACSPFRRDFPVSAANRLLWHVNLAVSPYPALLTQFQLESCSPEIFWGRLDNENQSPIILSLQMRDTDSA